MQPFLSGKTVDLCSLTSLHLQPGTPYFDWLNDLSLDLYSERSYFPNTQARMERYFDAANSDGKLVLLGIFSKPGASHIGNITLQQIDFLNRRGFLGYLVGDKNHWKKGAATSACLMLLYYAFNKLNLERVWTTVSTENTGSQKVARNAGLLLEGTLRGHQWRNGKSHDLEVYGIQRAEWMNTRQDEARAAFSTLPV